MFWPFTSVQREVHLAKVINAPPNKVLALLQDPNVLLSLSPLIVSVTPDSTEVSNSTYTVTEKISVGGIFNLHTQFKCQLYMIEDGVDIGVIGDMGTKLTIQYRVQSTSDGACEVTDTGVVESLSLMSPFILKTFRAAHSSALEALAVKAENRSNILLRSSSTPFFGGLSASLAFAGLIVAILIRFWPTSLSSVSSLLVLLAALFSFLCWQSKDPYGLFHLSLNKLPGEATDSSPKTEWLNMGYWKNTNIFPAACEGLCLKLLSAAQCQQGDHVLDVGHGTGESLVVLLSRPNIRPISVTGITSLPAHHYRSRKRVDKLIASLPTPTPEVNLFLGDAIFRSSQAGHPLNPSMPRKFNRILALDCAYHFNTRQDFLQQAYCKLATHGARIALADICFDAASFDSRLLSLVFRLMPRHNMVSKTHYVTQMKDIGYVDVELEDITDDVFPGFAKFLRTQGLGWALFATIIEWWHMKAGARFVIAVYIRGYEGRSDPKPHIVYRIEIQAHVRSWQMWRRYSEFYDLHIELTKAVGCPPPASLPPKHKFSFIRSHTDTKLLDERRLGLESYLRAILSAKEDQWRESFPFREFLGIPVSRQGVGPPTQFSAATWLDEHIELQTRIRTIRADINKRDALSDRGDVGGSHKANVAAKAKLAGLSTRMLTLEKGLEGLGLSGMSEGELQRRNDMIARLRDDHEKLMRMVTVARQNSRSSAGALNAPVPESDREALLSTNAAKPVTRVFGAQPKETEETRPLDDHGIFALRQVHMDEQDQQLAELSAVLRRQKQLGIAIGHEIGSQIELLDDLSNEVDRVGGKLTATNRQLNRLG
ncbi:hypothetical protein H0H93_012501 [Arthromyces matolae]|nr:hypothetical protein H0H93_012501 [Arthromyces matolae]